MTRSRNFDNDPQTKRLASYFEDLYEYLMEQGVPEDCLPSPWHVLRRVTGAINHEVLRQWLDAYAEVETISEISEEEEDWDESVDDLEPPQVPEPSPRPRIRPSYLRALDEVSCDADLKEQEEP